MRSIHKLLPIILGLAIAAGCECIKKSGDDDDNDTAVSGPGGDDDDSDGGTRPTPTLTGLPSGIYSEDAVIVTVTAEGVTEYRYKIGESSLVDCTAEESYAASTAVSDNDITADGEQSFAIYIDGASFVEVAVNTLTGANANASNFHYGIGDASTANVNVRDNFIRAGISSSLTGRGAAVTVGMPDAGYEKHYFNNVIDGGQSDDTMGFDVNFERDGAIFVRNNSVYSGFSTGGAGDSSAGVSLRKNPAEGGTATFENNIIYSDAAGAWNKYCFDETATIPSGRITIRNNDLYNCPEAVYQVTDDDCPGDCMTVGALESFADVAASGNVSLSLIYTDWANGDATLGGAPSVDVTQGGIDGSASGWPFAVDRQFTPRTNSIVGGPSNANAGGWTMGAYERD